MHALVIEDDAAVAMFIESLLLDAGFGTIAIAVTAEDAVSSARLALPAFITADVELIGSNGIDAVQEIGGFCAAPAIFVTSAVQQVRDRMPGAPILMKPFRAEDLLAYMPMPRN